MGTELSPQVIMTSLGPDELDLRQWSIRPQFDQAAWWFAMQTSCPIPSLSYLNLELMSAPLEGRAEETRPLVFPVWLYWILNSFTASSLLLPFGFLLGQGARPGIWGLPKVRVHWPRTLSTISVGLLSRKRNRYMLSLLSWYNLYFLNFAYFDVNQYIKLVPCSFFVIVPMSI